MAPRVHGCRSWPRSPSRGQEPRAEPNMQRGSSKEVLSLSRRGEAIEEGLGVSPSALGACHSCPAAPGSPWKRLLSSRPSTRRLRCRIWHRPRSGESPGAQRAGAAGDAQRRCCGSWGAHGRAGGAHAGASATAPLGPQKLKVLGDVTAAGPGSPPADVEGEAAGPPAGTVPCVSSKGQGRGPAGPGLRQGLVLFTSVRWLSGTGSP